MTVGGARAKKGTTMCRVVPRYGPNISDDDDDELVLATNNDARKYDGRGGNKYEK